MHVLQILKRPQHFCNNKEECFLISKLTVGQENFSALSVLVTKFPVIL